MYRSSKDVINTDYVYIFTNDSIKPIDSSVIEYTAMYLTNEGDLDNDGADDIGFLLHTGESHWGTYVAFSHKTPIQDFVRKDPTKAHCAIIKKIHWEHLEMQEIIIDLISETIL